jgi:hypothetical protein
MSTDYIVFIHGVNVRNEAAYNKQANEMFQNIKASINDSSRTLKPVILYWGNVGQASTNTLLKGLESSPQWKDFWFQDYGLLNSCHLWAMQPYTLAEL